MNTPRKSPPESSHPFVPSAGESLDDCDAVIIALKAMVGPPRYVIVRQDERQRRMFPTERICKRIRDLQPGDEVIYNGRRETVHGLCAF